VDNYNAPIGRERRGQISPHVAEMHLGLNIKKGGEVSYDFDKPDMSYSREPNHQKYTTQAYSDH